MVQNHRGASVADKHSKEFVTWLHNVSQSPHFARLMGLIAERRDGAQQCANLPGDTDYYKGQLLAYNWVLELPQDIISTVDDTDETSITAKE